MNCPKCNSTNIQTRGRRNALYPAGIVSLVGLPFAMLHQASAPYECTCNDCGAEFSYRTTTARVARVALFVVVGIMLLLLVLSICFLIMS